MIWTYNWSQLYSGNLWSSWYVCITNYFKKNVCCKERHWDWPWVKYEMSFYGGSVVKNLPANAGDVGLIPGLGRSPGERNDNPLQYSCLGNLMDRGVWWATVHKVLKESDTSKWLNNNKIWSREIFISLICLPSASLPLTILLLITFSPAHLTSFILV